MNAPRTVLVVDDQPLILAIVARVLSVAGYGVLQATDAAAALRLFQEEREHIALVLTDVQMPGMSGVEVGRRIWATDPSLPVLYMSGFTPEPLDFLPAGEQEKRWIAKPFSGDELLARLTPFLPPNPAPYRIGGSAIRAG
ncbi:MAG TPA: response regulator [Gemmatimonadales bacterium]|nr:response regulator [Gemmatimonadales bacterium]